MPTPGRPTETYLKVELKGEWKRANMPLEIKLHRAFPGADVEAFAVQLENRVQRLLIIASKATVDPESGAVVVEDLAVARLPAESKGTKAAQPTMIRTERAVFKLNTRARAVTDLSNRTVLSVEFANGVQMRFDGP